MRIIHQFLEWTSWKMDIIVPYSFAHRMILVVIFVTVVIFSFFMAKMSWRTERVLLICGIYMAVTETYKQFFLTYIYGGYSWSDFPFQLCAMPMYLCLLYPLFRARGKKIIRDMLMSYNLIGGVAALLEPTSSFTCYVTMTVHSIVWHGLLICIGLYLVFLDFRESNGKMRISVRSYLGVMRLYLICALLAVLFNALFKEVSGGTMNMFFLGPSYPNAVILNAIYERAGWVVETVSMIGVTAGAGFGVYCLEHIWGYLKKEERF